MRWNNFLYKPYILGYYAHDYFYLEALLKDEQRAKCGGVCWRSLTTISNYQYKTKIGEIQQTYTHAFIIDIVTLVLEIYYFVGLILKYKGIIVKIRHPSKRKGEHLQRRRRRPIQLPILLQSLA